MDNEVKDYLEYVADKDGIFEIHLGLDGIRCIQCIVSIENFLKKQKGVVEARGNIGAKTLFLSWRGDISEINFFVKEVKKLGYTIFPLDDASAKSFSAEEHALLKKVIVAGAAAVQIMMISMGVWAGALDGTITHYTQFLIQILATIIALPAIMYCGLPFFRNAYTALKNKKTNMDVPISIAIITSSIISVQETIKNTSYTYYDAAISLIFALLIGRYLDLKTRNKAWSYAHAVISSQPKKVIIEENGRLKSTDITLVNQGDIARICAGEKIPIDGEVISGETEIDNSLITGETAHKRLAIGDLVYAGAVNILETIKVRVLSEGSNTVLNEVIKLIENAAQYKAKYVQLADKVSSYYTPVVLFVSIFTFIIWKYFFETEFSIAILNAVAVLIITCPCALGLAVPVVQVVATSYLMKRRIFVKSQNALEKLNDVDVVLLDKTGTLTKGQIIPLDFEAVDLHVKEIIYAMVKHSKHPLSVSLQKAIERDDAFDAMSIKELDVSETRGMGLEERGSGIRLGNRRWCAIDSKQEDDLQEIWFISSDIEKPIRITFQDELRDGAQEMVTELKALGLEVIIISGDNQGTVKKVADTLGVQKYYWNIIPTEKYEMIAALQERRKKPLMVGDGFNDSAALKLAYVSASPTSALGIAQNCADIVFEKSLLDIVTTLKIAKKLSLLVKQNFAISICYNIISIPIAVMGFAAPIVAAIAMSTSSILVVLNSMRLNWQSWRI